MKFKKIIIGSIFGFVSCFTTANETVGKIYNLYVNAHGIVLFKIGDTAPPECVDDRFPFGFRLTDPAGKEWFSMLHEAQRTGKAINLSYNENTPSRCTVWAVVHKV
ncbi:MAG: hypothetical protein HRT53_16435 [Colwellia sp.]|nr:hypothetical protein [Colwellia sp.]